MATDLETALTQINTRILEITASPKPNYTVDGQSVKWGDYLKQLLESRKLLAEEIQNEDGPYEERTQVFT